MPAVRHETVARLVRILSQDAVPIRDRIDAFVAEDATDEEKSYAAGALAGAAVEGLKSVGVIKESAPRSILDLSCTDLRAEVRRGVALAFVLDRLGPLWASRPDVALVDVLKIVPPDEVARLADVLNRVGITDLDGSRG